MAITKVSRGLLSTGISDSSDATAITIDSSENVLLSNTTSLIGVNTSDGSDNKSVMINGGGAASDSRGGYVWIKGNEYSSDAGFLQLNAGNVSGAGIKFFTSGSERARILSSGGITFNGDTATDNALDDYEEGTWQATHGGNNMSGNGYYVKIGAFVHIQGDWTSASGSTSTNIIGGLPFASSGGHSSFIVGYTDSGGGHRGGYTASNNLYLVKNGTTSNNLSAGQRVLVQSTYYTTN